MLDSNMEMLRSLAQNVISRGGSPTAEAICRDTLNLPDEADRASQLEEQPIPEILE